ncbi:Ephrin rec like domain-containing protein [Citrus sinensis]|uniref:Ephrin rec like domain-containing protein n=1 Tax=Citrus sinensis TaxID=2711 RepID=A0ACB8LUD2_CITSI|nr:Ephrin rec like domain-containing protein [Citrus sinensis]
MRSYLWWCILLGYLYVSTLSFSSGQYLDRAIQSGNWLHDLGSDLKDDFKSTTLNFVEISILPSQLNDSVSCGDLEGVGSLNTTCLLNSNLYLNYDLYIYGTGNLEILPKISIVCPVEGCKITFNMSGNINMGQYAAIVAGSVVVSAANLTMDLNSSINTTSLGGLPPSPTSGTPVGYDGAGGGHGGRGASCHKNNKTSFWGGDVYAWSTLSEPWSYGSKGGGTSAEYQYGGNGGGRIKLLVKDMLYLNGSVTAEGGDGGLKGGGGSGGSIYVLAVKLKGYGFISAAGGRGWGGGGGGRVSLDCYSIQEDIKVTVHGGFSIGCPENAGAAGTNFNAYLRSLRVSNDNVTTETETPLLDFPTRPIWSNVFVENNAKVLVPLLWTRVQVRGQISLYRGGSIIFGLSEYPVSEFELVAEELLMSDSVIKVFGAFRVAIKMLLMWNSKILIDGGGNTIVTTSVLEVRNLVVLTENSVISSNANLGLYGQGLLQLTGQDLLPLRPWPNGGMVEGTSLSSLTVGTGSLLQAPLDDDASRNVVTESLCKRQTCPIDLINPPDDCHVNYTLSFSLQICRVEDIVVSGLIKGSIVHIQRARTIIVDTYGMIIASELGSGAGHGGRGGSGFFNGRLINGGHKYGNADLPCELGSGAEGPNESYAPAIGGGMIVMGSIQWPLFRLDIYGSVRADGESVGKKTINGNSSLIGGLGGGSGGTILLFLQELTLEENSSVSVVGGSGGPPGGGGGGGGRVHFHWSKIDSGVEYVPVATISGSINSSGGAADNTGLFGEVGTVTGKKCPKGLYGTFCKECPIGTYKDMEGSDESLCTPCSLELLPRRANFIYVRGGVSQPFCPYECISDKYRMPNCYTPLEELMYTFGGPWPFVLLLSCILVLLALLLSTLRIKLVGSSPSYREHSIERHSRHHFPYLLSLSEVRGTRAEETQSHVHRMYFMGPNTFREPWHLPYSPPNAIIEIVYEDAFNRFIDEINSVAAYDWWEGSIHSILTVLAYPCAWSWKQWRRRNKIHRLQEYVKSEYDHSCLRSCRSRALYKGMKVGATPDLMVAYIDFFLGGDEKRLDIVSIIQKRFPMCIIFGGNGSYMSPYNLHNDAMMTNLLAQHVPATVWSRLVDGLNAQLRTVRQGSIRSALVPVIDWINSHGNPQLEFHGVKIELGWFQPTASGYYQLGILIVAGDYSLQNMQHSDLLDNSIDYPRKIAACSDKSRKQQQSWLHTNQSLSLKKITGGINGGLINHTTVKYLEFKRDFLFPVSLLLHNTRPVGRQDTIQLLITIMLLADLSITLLTLLEFYWISLGAFLAVLLVLPLSLLSPFPAGLNALFSKEPRRSSLTRIYALWNATSLSNIVVAFISGICHYGFWFAQPSEKANTWFIRREGDNWWLLPTILVIFKSIQARFVDWHIANLEIGDYSLFCPDPDAFWAHEPSS